MGIKTNLKVFRVNRGLSLRQLGEQADIPFNYIAAFEKGRMVPTPDEIEKLCRALGVAFEDLYPNPATRELLLQG